MLRSFPRYTLRIAYQTLPCHIRLLSLFLPLTHPGHPWILLHVPTMWVLFFMVVPHEQRYMRIKRPPPPDYLYSSLLFFVAPSPLHEKEVLAFSPLPIGPWTFHGRSTRERMLLTKRIHTFRFYCGQKSIERWRRGIEGHHNSGDTTRSSFWNRRFVKKKSKGLS